MKVIQSIDEYVDLLKQNKQRWGRLLTNSYLSLDAIQRYVELKRLYYLQLEKGIVFLCDEKTYYRLLYWWEIGSQFYIPKMDKPIAIRNIYVEGRKRKELIDLEKQLEHIGSRKEYTAIEMCVPLEAGETISKQKKVFERMLQKGGFHIAYLQKENIEQMLSMRERKEFHVYNFAYRTNDEIISEIDNLQYVAIYSDEREMCACIYRESHSGIVTGDGICVEEKYKQTYGLGAALMCHILDNAINIQGKRYVSWCEVDNLNSMRFHRSIGFVNTGKISDEWILK